MTEKTSLSVEPATLQKFNDEKIYFYKIAKNSSADTDDFLLYLLDLFHRHRRSNK